MSQKLMNQTKNKMILENLRVARSMRDRAVGLLGRKNLAANEGLWILKCNSIHTYFMQFAIDCVFVDRHLQVKAINKNIKPWRVVFPIWKATSVFEMSSGTIEKLNIEIGDQLHVVS